MVAHVVQLTFVGKLERHAWCAQVIVFRTPVDADEACRNEFVLRVAK
jgi:hypothetical protein